MTNREKNASHTCTRCWSRENKVTRIISVLQYINDIYPAEVQLKLDLYDKNNLQIN